MNENFPKHEFIDNGDGSQTSKEYRFDSSRWRELKRPTILESKWAPEPKPELESKWAPEPKPELESKWVPEPKPEPKPKPGPKPGIVSDAKTSAILWEAHRNRVKPYPKGSARKWKKPKLEREQPMLNKRSESELDRINKLRRDMGLPPVNY